MIDTPILSRPMDRETVAMLCHEMNRKLQALTGEAVSAPWLACDDHIRQSSRDGVDFVRAHPDAPPSASHDNWLKFKRAAGWTYGPHKDEKLKQHPCMMPHGELPHDQQIKDSMFMAIVRALT